MSIIIPAFDEAGTVARCVEEALNCPEASEVIVIDDGSSDNTALLAASAGARVVRLAQNVGKAAAMNAGVHAARYDIILFLDADVTGHTPQVLSDIVQPVIRGQYEMYVGIRARKTLWLNRLLHFFPIIGGDRAITRRLWEAVPKRYQQGFKIEIALNHTSKKFDRGMGFHLMPGTRHEIKEIKYGVIAGFTRRMFMVVDVVAVSLQIYVIDPAVTVARRGKIQLQQWLKAS